MRRLWLIILAFIFFAPMSVEAQTVINPRTVEFDVSPDHDRLILSMPIVTGYRIDFYLIGATAPVQAGDLGKPTPDAAGHVVITRPELFALPIGGYVARVVAVGPGGEGASVPSDPFGEIGPPGVPGGKPSLKR